MKPVTQYLFILCLLAAASLSRAAEDAATAKPPAQTVEFIRWGFENASPLQWEVSPDHAVHVHMLYDYERGSPNRAAGHWHFQLQGKPGSDVTLVLHNFDNVYNGKPGPAVSKKSICYVFPDGKHWKVLPAELVEGNSLRIRVHLDGNPLYVARLEPYRVADLEQLLDEIRGHRLVEIAPIGKTVEGRPPIPNLRRHLDRMRLFEQLLRRHTWLTEGSSGPKFRNVGTIGEGLLERYGIDACILELNCNWIAGLKQYPSGERWEQFGRQLREVFFDYFAEARTKGGSP